MLGMANNCGRDPPASIGVSCACNVFRVMFARSCATSKYGVCIMSKQNEATAAAGTNDAATLTETAAAAVTIMQHENVIKVADVLKRAVTVKETYCDKVIGLLAPVPGMREHFVNKNATPETLIREFILDCLRRAGVESKGMANKPRMRFNYVVRTVVVALLEYFKFKPVKVETAFDIAAAAGKFVDKCNKEKVDIAAAVQGILAYVAQDNDNAAADIAAIYDAIGEFVETID